jgi:hypothetical protein
VLKKARIKASAPAMLHCSQKKWPILSSNIACKSNGQFFAKSVTIQNPPFMSAGKVRELGRPPGSEGHFIFSFMIPFLSQ